MYRLWKSNHRRDRQILKRVYIPEVDEQQAISIGCSDCYGRKEWSGVEMYVQMFVESFTEEMTFKL